MVRKLIEVGLSKRDEAGIKVRQPLTAFIIKTVNLEVVTIKNDNNYLDLLKDELNVKNIIFETESDGKSESDNIYKPNENDVALINEFKKKGMSERQK